MRTLKNRKYFNENKQNKIKELADEQQLLSILIKNKIESNDKLRAWMRKNAPDTKIPEVVPTPPVIVIPDTDPAAGEKNETNEENLPPIPFAYSFEYLEYIT